MTWYVYILLCADNSFYVGHTDDIEERVDRHNQGRGAMWTACRNPVTLVYHEMFCCERDAITRESQVNDGPGRKKMP